MVRAETAKEARSQGDGNTELMRLGCVQLFLTGTLEDVFLIWQAKRASMDAASAIDVQLLCGRGLARTKVYLSAHTSDMAKQVLARIVSGESEPWPDFEDFTPEGWAAQLVQYYEG